MPARDQRENTATEEHGWARKGLENAGIHVILCVVGVIPWRVSFLLLNVTHIDDHDPVGHPER